MLPLHKLIVLSSISLTVISACITYYLIKVKEKRNYLFILLLISFLPLVSILRPGTYESGDLSINAIKTMVLYQSLSEGTFPANWGGELNATYGYPLYNFTYPLPYYTAALFHLIGFSFIDSVKLVLIVAYISSGIGMYFFLKKSFSAFIAFSGSIFYLFAPYRFVDMHFRVDIGECFAFIFIPLLFLFGMRLLQKTTLCDVIFLSFSLAGLLLSHQAVSLATLPFWMGYILVYVIVYKIPLRSLISIAGGTILGFCLASFYVLPVIFELQYTLQPHMQSIFYPAFFEFIYSPWRYGLLFQGHKGELSFIIGYAQMTIVLLSCYLLWKRKIKKNIAYMTIFLLSCFMFLFFMMQSISQPLWYLIPLIKNFQFSYRLLSVVVFVSALLAAYVCSLLPKKGVYILLFLAIFSTILNWGNRRTIPEIHDSALAQSLPLSTYAGEGLGPAVPKWVDKEHIWFTQIPQKHLQIIQGKGEVKQIVRTTSHHSYTIIATSPLLLQENTLYFPGWNIQKNGESIPIQISKRTNSQGVMTFSVPKGNHKIDIKYDPTPIRKISSVISLLALLIVGALGTHEHIFYSKIITLSKRT